MYYIPSNIRHAFLVITDACNLNCTYCFVKQQPHYMSLSVAKDSVDFLNQIKGEDLHIQYFGGEPTLMWDSIIVPLQKYIKTKGYNIRTGITSNGILLDENKINFMKENNMDLLFSMDGDKYVQDVNRPCKNEKLSSFDILKPKLKLISSSFPNVTFRSTFTPRNSKFIFDSIMFARDYGFNNVFTCPNDFQNSEYTEENYKEIEAELCRYTLYYIDNYRKANLPNDFIELRNFEEAMTDVFIMDEKNKEPIEKPIGQLDMCGLAKYGFGINFEGKIFGCHELCSDMYENNKHYIGSIYLGLDEDRVKDLRDTYVGKEIVCEDSKMCINCNRYTVCRKGICHANSYQRFGTGNIKSKIRCVYDQLLIKYAYLAREILISDNNSFFYKKYNKKR